MYLEEEGEILCKVRLVKQAAIQYHVKEFELHLKNNGKLCKGFKQEGSI